MASQECYVVLLAVLSFIGSCWASTTVHWVPDDDEAWMKNFVGKQYQWEKCDDNFPKLAIEMSLPAESLEEMKKDKPIFVLEQDGNEYIFKSILGPGRTTELHFELGIPIDRGVNGNKDRRVELTVNVAGKNELEEDMKWEDASNIIRFGQMRKKFDENQMEFIYSIPSDSSTCVYKRV